MAAIHFNRPRTWLLRAVMACPNCKTRRRFSGRLQAWYGTTWTCCHCGDAFADGQRLPRPFKRGWREEAAKKARCDWDQAVSTDNFDWDEFRQATGL